MSDRWLIHVTKTPKGCDCEANGRRKACVYPGTKVPAVRAASILIDANCLLTGRDIEWLLKVVLVRAAP